MRAPSRSPDAAMTDDSNTLAFDELADVFWRLGALHSPAELHGYLVGQLAAGAELPAQQWLAQAVDFLDCKSAPQGGDETSLLALYESVTAQLQSDSFDLQLLLPDDDYELEQRVLSLGQWCQGFLAGFALAGKQRQKAQGQRAYTEDVTDAIKDLVAISQIGVDEDEVGEDSEHSFFDLCEHVRLAALQVHEDCRPPAAVQAPTSHQIH